MDIDIRSKIEKLLDLQIKQTSDITEIKTFQKTHKERIDKIEKEARTNSNYRYKSTGALAIIYILVGIFGSLLAKKL